MLESFHYSSNSFSSTNDSIFLISDLIIPLQKEKEEEEGKTDPSINRFCCWFYNYLYKCFLK